MGKKENKPAVLKVEFSKEEKSTKFVLSDMEQEAKRILAEQIKNGSVAVE